MGSVIEYIDCPNCGSPDCFDDFYYKTGEEYIFCNKCGYHRSSHIISREKSLDQLTENDWEYNESTSPYGAYRYSLIGNIGSTCGTLETESDADEFRIEMERNENGAIEYASISRFIDNQIVETILINNTNENQNG